MLGIQIGLILSFMLASALSRGIKGTTSSRTIYYMPVISSLAEISILWHGLYKKGDFLDWSIKCYLFLG